MPHAIMLIENQKAFLEKYSFGLGAYSKHFDFQVWHPYHILWRHKVNMTVYDKKTHYHLGSFKKKSLYFYEQIANEQIRFSEPKYNLLM